MTYRFSRETWRAIALGLLASLIVCNLWGCSLPPSCPKIDVADTVAIMGTNSHGVRDTLGLAIYHKTICK